MWRSSSVLVAAGLLLLLTYLLIQSRSPGQPARARALESLQALQQEDAALNRAVLMVRAGLQPHYDSLAEIRRRLANELHTLQRHSHTLGGSDHPEVAHQARALEMAVERKHRLVEHFTSDIAVVRNSTTYFGQLVLGLGRVAERDAPSARALAASHVVMRFVQAPSTLGRKGAEAAIASLGRGGLEGSVAAALVAHARIIVDLMPLVDVELRSIVTSPVALHTKAFQEALLRSAGAGESRAQRFRLMLYAAALALLIYLMYVFARWRANARELRRKDTQLIQANKMTALGTLVSSVAHEVNNPNQVVLANVGILTSAWHDAIAELDGCGAEAGGVTLAGLPYGEMRDVMPRLLRDTEDSARRIERIVSDLKNFARPETRVSELFQLNEVVQRAIRLLTHLIRKRTDAFDVQLADALPPVRGNPHHLEQVAVNLVVNALEALPEKAAAVMVTTAHDADAGHAILAVRDQGVGMTRQQLARLGEAFFTTRASNGGTGLGIAIASSLVRLHHGSLTFTSQPGSGTCATVTLPLPGEARSADLIAR
jgi:signal transduction histidine kinase